MKKVIYLYYAFQLCFSMLIWLPIFYEFQKAIGLSDTEIFRIQTIYYIAFCLLELPTGFIADRFGFRTTIILGGLTLTAANLLPVAFGNYPAFLTHFLLIALARSLISGASSAYLYEWMSSHQMASEYKNVEGKARAYSLIGRVAVWPLAGFMMARELTLPYSTTAVFSFLSFVVALKLPPLKQANQTIEEVENKIRETFLSQIPHLFSTLRKNPFFILLMLQGTAIFVLVRICQVNLYQPIMKVKGFSVEFFGTAMSLMTIFEAIGTYRPSFLRRHMDDTNAVFFVTLIIALSLIGMAFLGQTGTLLSFFVFSLAAGLSFPIQRQVMNDNVPDVRFRASLLSMESILDRAVSAAIAPLIGIALEANNISGFLNTSALVTIIFIAILFFAMKRVSKS